MAKYKKKQNLMENVWQSIKIKNIFLKSIVFAIVMFATVSVLFNIFAAIMNPDKIIINLNEGIKERSIAAEKQKD